MKGYSVQVEGEYIARPNITGGDRLVKKYEVTVNLPSMDRAMSVIKNKLLKPALLVKYDDFVVPRTYHITKIEALDEESQAALKKVPVQYMNRETLIQFIESENLPVDADLYPNLFKLREAVEGAQANPEDFAKKQEERRESLIEDQTLAGMNPGLFAKDENTAQVAAPERTKKTGAFGAVKALPKVAHEKQTEDRINALGAEIERTAQADLNAADV